MTFWEQERGYFLNMYCHIVLTVKLCLIFIKRMSDMSSVSSNNLPALDLVTYVLYSVSAFCQFNN